MRKIILHDSKKVKERESVCFWEGEYCKQRKYDIDIEERKKESGGFNLKQQRKVQYRKNRE